MTRSKNRGQVPKLECVEPTGKLLYILWKVLCVEIDVIHALWKWAPLILHWMLEFSGTKGAVNLWLSIPVMTASFTQYRKDILPMPEIQPVHPKGNQSWIFIGKTDAEAETPILWSPDPKNWLIWKDPDAGKDWRQEEKGMTEDEMVGWHHWLNGHEFKQDLGVDDEQRDLACCSPQGHRVGHDWATELNWTEKSGGPEVEAICQWIPAS